MIRRLIWFLWNNWAQWGSKCNIFKHTEYLMADVEEEEEEENRFKSVMNY